LISSSKRREVEPVEIVGIGIGLVLVYLGVSFTFSKIGSAPALPPFRKKS
jgi:hypothetical protein